MASKVLVPTAPFAKLQVKKSPPEPAGSGFIIGQDAVARVAHLEHSVRFLQEQHRLMLSGLHAEIEALRERNRDLQFQLIFNKESSAKANTPSEEAIENSEETKLKREVSRLETEATAARSEARAAEARALQLQRVIDAQAEKLRVVELKPSCGCVKASEASPGDAESRAALRARLAEAERLVRRLRADAERHRAEVVGGRAPAGVTNLLFDAPAATHAHLQCMKNSLHASLRASGLEPGFGYHNNYHFPPLHHHDIWREPHRDECAASRGRPSRRPVTLPELATPQMHRSTVFANNHARVRANGFEQKSKKSPPADTATKTPEELSESCLKARHANCLMEPKVNTATYPELKIVVTKMIPHGNVSGQTSEASRAKPRRHHHRKHNAEHT